MTRDEQVEYKRRISGIVSINVIKLNDIQFGYRLRGIITDRSPLSFDLQSTNDNKVLKVIKGIQTCVINDHYGFVNALNSIEANQDITRLPNENSVELLKMKLDLINQKYSGNFNLIYHGKLESESTGYKYILMYSNIAQNMLKIFKIRGLNIETQDL